MNVLFHTATAIATVVLVVDCGKSELGSPYLLSCFLSLILGVIFHGVLDYMPHCYPVNSKADVVISLMIMIFLLWKAERKYKLLVAASFAGNVLPDIVDLSPAILNKLFRLNIILLPKMFPWHWPSYSGSIYSGTCNVSNLNHIMIVVMVCIVCWNKRKEFKTIFLCN